MRRFEENRSEGYRHRQFALIRYGALLAVAFIMVLLMIATGGHTVPTLLLLAVIIVAALSHTLTIELDEQSLGWSFRPRLGQWRLPIATIARVQIEPVGAMAHLGAVKLRRGWLYAAAPGDCVAITTADGRELFIGTDDAANLVSAINAARGLNIAKAG